MEKEEEKVYDITNDIKEPFDYGSEEYLKVVEKIKKNREEYRRQQELKKFKKFTYFGKEYQ